MSRPPRVSVVVASHRRPEALKLCLKALTQLDYAELEVVVAADAAGLAAVEALGLGPVVKTVRVEAPGLSVARNAAIARAAGEVIAFIDDDAVAEPSWLKHLTAPFVDPEVAAAGGFVRGRNGISFQWKARTVDAGGAHAPLEVDDRVPSLHPGNGNRAIKTEGTNMAVRRSVLARLGGFDPAYRFYMDETDLNMRLAREGAVTAVVPLAQVHHGFAESAWRAANRVPRDLFDIGASTAVFLRKFAAEAERAPALDALRAAERDRLARHVRARRLKRADVGSLLDGLEAGIAAGLVRPLSRPPSLQAPDAPFLPFPAAPDRVPVALAGRVWNAARLRRRAAGLVARGQPVTVFLFGPTARPHRMYFRPDGIWEQRGGLFGRADRAEPVFKMHSFSSRLSRELDRLDQVRPHRSA